MEICIDTRLSGRDLCSCHLSLGEPLGGHWLDRSGQLRGFRDEELIDEAGWTLTWRRRGAWSVGQRLLLSPSQSQDHAVRPDTGCDTLRALGRHWPGCKHNHKSQNYTWSWFRGHYVGTCLVGKSPLVCCSYKCHLNWAGKICSVTLKCKGVEVNVSWFSISEKSSWLIAKNKLRKMMLVRVFF